jgi:hypothetical protein
MVRFPGLVVIVGVVLAGCASPGPKGIDSLKVVASPGCWKGTLHIGGSAEEVEGCSNESWSVDGYVSATMTYVPFLKAGDRTPSLCVQLLSSGEVVKEDCTTMNYGTATVHA